MKSSWMLVAAVLFALMGALVKLGAARFSSGELVFYRSALGLIVLWVAMGIAHGGVFRPFATPHWRTHLWRGLSGFTALVLFFHVLAILPLATAVTLNYTAPLFLAALSAGWLGERHGRGLLTAVGLGFAGVVLLLRPQLGADQTLPALMGLASGLLAALAYVHIKRLGTLGEPGWRVVFHFTLLSTVGGALWMVLIDFTPPRAGDWPLLIAIGVVATLAQLALTRAYQRGRTLLVGALAYTTVGFSAVFGWGIFDETLPPLAWAGMALVAAAGVLAAWSAAASTAATLTSTSASSD